VSNNIIDQRVKFLRKVKIFADTNTSALAKIAPLLEERSYGQTETVIRKGERGESVFLIASGQVAVYDQDFELSRLGPGDVFGEYSLIDTQTRSATVRTTKPSTLYELSQKNFIPIITTDLNVLRSFLRIFVDRLRKHDQLEWQLKEKNNQIFQQKTHLERLNEEKSHLMGIVAHDVRNPLTTAMNLSQLLSEEISHLNEEHRECFQIISESLNRIHELVREILDVQVIERNMLQIQTEEIRPSQLLEKVHHSFLPKINQKNLTISTDLADETAFADSKYLKQVYENLISNAIKFSPPGNKIFLKIYKQDNQLISEIRDEGPGISDEDQEHLFEQFVRLSARPTGDESSYGLGLSIVKKYVEAMGGRVWCESRLGEGAVFKVALLHQ